MRDHIVSHEIDHRPSYGSYGLRSRSDVQKSTYARFSGSFDVGQQQMKCANRTLWNFGASIGKPCASANSCGASSVSKKAPFTHKIDQPQRLGVRMKIGPVDEQRSSVSSKNCHSPLFRFSHDGEGTRVRRAALHRSSHRPGRRHSGHRDCDRARRGELFR
jgi:hypothetical protein